MNARNHQVDVLIVGAGPAGLATSLELGHLGVAHRVLDRGGLVESLYRFPVGMRFFTTRELLEIGGVPFPSVDPKPTREQALAYYRAAARDLPFTGYLNVVSLSGGDGDFEAVATDRRGDRQSWRSRKVVVAVGTFQEPNLLDVPGESLAKVYHYYQEAHPFTGCKVMVVGGANSAAEAALDLHRAGAEVTLVHRGEDFSRGLKYWVRPDLDNRIKEGSIRALMQSRVEAVEAARVIVRDAEANQVSVDNDFLFALIGTRPERDVMERFSLSYDPDTLVPVHDAESFESSRPGVYVVGSLLAGRGSGKIFIENGRFHGREAARHLAGRL